MWGYSLLISLINLRTSWPSLFPSLSKILCNLFKFADWSEKVLIFFCKSKILISCSEASQSKLLAPSISEFSHKHLPLYNSYQTSATKNLMLNNFLNSYLYPLNVR